MNILIPAEPKPGEPLKASWASAIVRALRALRPAGGTGVIVTTTANGTTFSAVARPVSAFTFTHPFKITVKDATHIKIEKGTVNNELPGDMVVGEDYLLAITETKTICILCTFDDNDGSLKEAEFKQEFTEPTKTSYCIRIGEVSFSGSKITAVSNYVTSSLGVAACPDGFHPSVWQLGALETGDITGGGE